MPSSRPGSPGSCWTPSPIEVVGEAGSVGEAVVRISSQPPDVVLLDVHMPDGGGRAVLEQVHAKLPGEQLGQVALALTGLHGAMHHHHSGSASR